MKLIYKLFQLTSIIREKEKSAAEKYLFDLGIKEIQCLKLYKSIRPWKGLPPEMGLDTKRRLFRNVFPIEEYNDSKMRKLMSRLTHLLEDFLIEQEIKHDQHSRQKLLLSSLHSRGNYKLFKETAEDRLAELEQQSVRGTDYFHEKQQILHSLYFHPETSRLTVKNDYFQQATRDLEWYIALASLMNGAECMARNRVLSVKESNGFFDVSRHLVQVQADASPVVADLFCRLIELLQKMDPSADLPSLQSALFSIFPHMSRHEQGMALKLLAFYATGFSNQGSRYHSRFLFEIYRLGCESRLHLNHDNSMDVGTFLNIATLGCLIGELEWTADFIKTHSPLLPEKERRDALRLSLAEWHHQKGLKNNDLEELDQAQRLISNIPTQSDEIYNYRVRSLLLRIQFEAFQMGAETLDYLLAQAQNFDRYVRTNRTYSTAKKASYLHFILHFRNLAKMFNQTDMKVEVVQHFLETLNSDINCTSKVWLNEKAEMLLAPLPSRR